MVNSHLRDVASQEVLKHLSLAKILQLCMLHMEPVQGQGIVTDGLKGHCTFTIIHFWVELWIATTRAKALTYAACVLAPTGANMQARM